ncbi:MAG: diacylglycerol kinase family protein [Thermodesulfobacteriota bacterium]
MNHAPWEPKMKVYLLVNPKAGGGGAVKTARETARILEAAGVSYDLAESASAQDVTDRARLAARQGYDRVLVVGGDGTWHYALNGLAHTGTVGAIVPSGRGNDFGRNLHLPGTLPETVAVALRGQVRELDLVWTGLRHYVGVAGVGFDSEVTECANTKVPLFTGALAYTAAVFYKLFSFKPKRLRIVHDQGVFDGLVMFAVFGNSKSYGGGMFITPEAEMDDGLIDVLIVHKIGVLNLLATMPKVFSGRHLPHPSIETLRTTRAELTSPDKMDLYGDGEYIQPVPTTLEIRPKALKVAAPPAG